MAAHAEQIEGVEDHRDLAPRCATASGSLGVKRRWMRSNELRAERVERDDLAVEHGVVERQVPQRVRDLRVVRGAVGAAAREDANALAALLGERAHAVVLELEEPAAARENGRPSGVGEHRAQRGGVERAPRRARLARRAASSSASRRRAVAQLLAP